MGKLKSSVLLAFGLSIGMLAGCATQKPPTVADFMRADAAEGQAQVDQQSQLAAEWEKGAKLVAEGEKKVQEGEKLSQAAERDLQRGRELVKIGNQEIVDGKRMMQASEESFGGDVGSGLPAQ